MLSAFQLENNRLTRLEAEESQPSLMPYGWIWSSRTTMSAFAYNLSWGKAWQPARNWKTSKHLLVF